MHFKYSLDPNYIILQFNAKVCSISNLYLERVGPTLTEVGDELACSYTFTMGRGKKLSEWIH